MLFIKSSFTLSLSVHVISCSCNYIYAAFFCLFRWRLMKVNVASMPAHARSNSELAYAVLFLPPRRRHVVSLLLSEMCLGHEMIKDHARPSGHRWSRSQPEADLISHRMALKGDRNECSTLMSIWPPPQLRKQFNVDRARPEPDDVLRLSRCQTGVQTDTDFSINQELSGKHPSVLLTLGVPNPVQWSSVCVAVSSTAFCVCWNISTLPGRNGIHAVKLKFIIFV